MPQRVLDATLSALLLMLCSPLFLLAALAVLCTDRGLVFYRQQRAGLHGRPFELIKFRSMKVNDQPVDRPGEVGSDDPLVTSAGKILRRTKLDELPQLINVLRGDMTWIGPRPTLVSQVEKYSPFEWRRMNALPGMTGWAQINGGSNICWPERIALDVWYADHRTPMLEAQILGETMMVMLRGNQANTQRIAAAVEYREQQELRSTAYVETAETAARVD